MSVHPTALVEDGAVLGDGVEIGPFCHVGPRERMDWTGMRSMSPGRTGLRKRALSTVMK